MAKAPLEFEYKISADEFNRFLSAIENGVAGAARDFNAALSGDIKKKIVLETVTDESGVKRLVAVEKEYYSEVEKILRAQKDLNRIEEGSLTNLRQRVNKARQDRDEIAKTKTSIDEYGRSVQTANLKWQAQNALVVQLERELANASASNFWDRAKAGLNAEGFVSFLNGLNQITLGLQSASIVIGQITGAFNNLVNVVSNIQQFELTFASIGATQDEVQLALSESSRVALGLGVSLQSVRDTFQQLSPIVLATGGSINDVSAITEALSSRFAAFGLSGDKARRVLNGITQAFGKGRLQAEELTQQIGEADPAFRVDLANAIGVTSKELGELVKNGEITDKVLVDILPKLSKSAQLFGRLGNSATDAAKALRKDIKDGGITLEQFRNQIASLNQLNLQAAGQALEPLIISLKELEALFVDLATTIVRSQAFKTLASFLNNLGTQFSGVAQATGQFLNVFFNIVNVVLSVLDAFDGLLARLVGFKPILPLLAGLITTKLVVALLSLSVKGVAGLAIGGITRLILISKTFATQGLAGLVKGITGAVLSFTGLTRATLAQVAADVKAVGSTQARAAAIAKLRAIETKFGSLGAVSGNVQLAAQAAGQRAVARSAAEAATATGALAAGTTAAAGAAGKAATPVAAFGSRLKGLGQGARGAIGSLVAFGGATLAASAPVLGLGLVAAGLTFTLLEQYKALAAGKNELDKFNTAYDGIEKRTNDAISTFQKAGSTSQEFNEKLSQLRVSSEKEFQIRIGTDNLNKRFDEIERKSRKTFENARNSVQGYNEDLDKTGRQGLITGQRLAAAEQVNQEALDVTRAKRDELTDRATKGGTAISASNLKILRSYQKNIEALETQRDEIRKLKEEAGKKGIPVNINTAAGGAVLDALQERIKNLQAEIVLEADPKAYAETQSKINGLSAQLAFLKADRVQIAIDLKFKVDTDRLKIAQEVSRAILDNLTAEVELSDAINNLFVSRIGAAEKEKSVLLEATKERLDKEKEIREERLETLKDSKASESAIAALEKENRAADKKAATQIKAIENEIKRIQEQKRAQEAEGIRQKLKALPAQQDAERQSLAIAQNLRRLDQERLRLAIQRSQIEGQTVLTDLEDRRLKAVERRDFGAAEQIQEQIDAQKQLLENLRQESLAIDNIIGQTRVLDALEQSTLDKKQEAAQVNLQASLAALGQEQSAQGINKSAQGAAAQTRIFAGNLTTAEISAEKLRQSFGGAVTGVNQLVRQIAAASGIDLSAPANGAAAGYNDAADAAGRLGREASNFQEIPTEGPSNLVDVYEEARQKALGLGEAIQGVETNSGEYEDNVQVANEELGGGVSSAQDIAAGLRNGATQAQEIASAIAGLDGLTVNVNVNGIPGLWTGGTAMAGTQYRVNELGQEGFLSAAGRLSAINKPKNALWRAPSTGTVIPAHLWSQLNIPDGGIGGIRKPPGMTAGRGGLQRLAGAIQTALSQRDPARDAALGELSAVQAQQAIQIGKLSRAVDRFADKKWDVHVGVKSTGNAAYLEMLNHRL